MTRISKALDKAKEDLQASNRLDGWILRLLLYR